MHQLSTSMASALGNYSVTMRKIYLLIGLFAIIIHAEADDSLLYAEQTQPSEKSVTFFTGLVMLSAQLTLPVAELIASDDAANELRLFRTGQHDGLPIVFRANSQATVELLRGVYYQELSDYLITAMTEWYGGKIPEDGALYVHSDTFRVFSGFDALTEIVDGIDMADIIGTMTYYVRMTTSSGIITFHAVNIMSLSSYSGEHYFQHDWVSDPEDGKFKSRVQVFQWQQIIPADT